MSRETDRVVIQMPEDMVERMRGFVAAGVYESVDACVEAALAGDPANWRLPKRRERNVAVAVSVSDSQPELEPQDLSIGVICSCCKPGCCQNQFRWRGTVRCACPRELADRSRVVQPDLEREKL